MWMSASFAVVVHSIVACWNVCDAVTLTKQAEAVRLNTAEDLRPSKKSGGSAANFVLAETPFGGEFGDLRGGEVLVDAAKEEVPAPIVADMLAPVAEELGRTLEHLGREWQERAHQRNAARDKQKESGGQSGMGVLDMEAPAFHKQPRTSATAMVFGVLFVFLAVSIQWFNEERSAKSNVLVSRGLSECKHVDADDLGAEHRGKLVHVQNRTRAAHPIMDDRFPGATVMGCLKLQSTIEVFEWSQTMKSYLDEKKEKKSQARFHTEWSTEHKNSTKLFKKPSPENPRLPTGLVLGTMTKKCTRVELGPFVLTDDMVNRFHKFEPAMERLPEKLVSHGLTFFANISDGYYYARPADCFPDKPASRPVSLFAEPQVGDIRIRFLCVPEGDATVVGVQCERAPDAESFVPYRMISRPPCITESQERVKLIEEGDRPLKDLRRTTTCCTSCPGRCCCCMCSLVACCTREEVITEEIFYVSDSLDPVEKAFEMVVRRNPWRVWMFRLCGWLILYLGVTLLMLPFTSHVQGAPGLVIYGRSAPFVLAVTITAACSAFIMACTYACYKPVVSFRWCIGVGIIIAAPLVYGSWT